ncbi:MAG: LysR family transcriptional regulator [Elusimicrobia bacterium]|nr:LysR family transcriptional regulator [Elusimicrobiota bacterium]
MIALNHHHLYYFWVVAKEGGVTKACRKLYLAQPTVSAQIIQLERSLGKKLFEREKKRLVLTDDGRLVLDYAGAIFGMAQELLDAIKDRPTGRTPRIQLGIVDQVSKQVARSLLKEIYRFKPGAQATVLEGTLGPMLAELRTHAADLVLSNVEVPVEEAAEYERALVGKLPVVFVAVPALARKVRAFPADLSAVPLLLPTRASPVWAGVERFLNRRGVEPRIVGEVQDVELLRLLALDGMGAAPIDQWTVAEDLRSGKLKCLGRGGAGIEEAVWLVAKKKHRLNPIAQHLLQRFRLGNGLPPR